jgi:integrase
MASIHHKEGSKNWYCCYSLPNGKRVYCTTETTNRAEAMRRACEIEAKALAMNAETSAPQRTVLAQVQEAAALAKRGDLSLDRAREIVGRMVETSTGKKMRFYTAKEWGAEWLAGKNGSTAMSTLSQYSRFIRGFLTFIGPLADAPIEQLDESNFRGYRDELRKRKRTARTCNQALKILRGWMRSAVNHGHLARNSSASVPMLIESDSIERAPFAPKELARLLKTADSSWRGVVMLGIYGGMRLRDATNLRWSSVDMRGRVIRFLPMKTARKKKEVVVPIHPALLVYLKTLPLPIHSSNFLFPDLAGKPSGGKTGLSIPFNSILIEAKIERDKVRVDANGKRVIVGRRTFHSLRHTFTSMLAKGGVSEGLRMELAGHKTPDMARHYTHHELETLRAAVGTLPNF